VDCPACLHAFHDKWKAVHVEHIFGTDGDIRQVETTTCPTCHELIVRLRRLCPSTTGDITDLPETLEVKLLHPPSPPRRAPDEVDEPYASDYEEAALVLSDSPKASAAVSRRLLQSIIRDKAGFKKASLDQEIQAVIDAGQVPTDLVNDLDALRTVGNFAAHPTKSTNTGEVVEVEPGEAGWLLDLLDDLFDYYFIRPARRKDRRGAVNAKLAEAGKPPLKGT
jgi:hypothetical protein